MAPAHPRGWVAGCFFLFFFSSSLLLFFFEEKKQKKISYGTAVFLCRCCFRLHIAQNGRFPCGPSVFYVMGRMHRERACSRPSLSAAESFVSFLQERPWALLPYRLKIEAKENQLRNSCFSLLLLFSPAYCTKRAVPMRAVRFLCHGQDAPGTCLLPSIPCPALSFISFLQEKKTSPFLK